MIFRVACCLTVILCGSSLFAQDAAQMPNRCEKNPAIGDIAASPSWNGWGADAANTRFQPATAAQLTSADVPRLKLKWAFGFPDARAVSGQPAVVAGRVYVSSDNGYVYSLDSATGCVYWSFLAEAAVRSSVTVERLAAGKSYAVFFGDARSNVYAIDASSGSLIWKARVEDHPTARITGGVRIFEGRLYVPVASGEEGSGGAATYECCTFRGSVVALSAETGRQVWKTYTIAEEPKRTVKSVRGNPAVGTFRCGRLELPDHRFETARTVRRYGQCLQRTCGADHRLHRSDGSGFGQILWSVQDTENDVWLAVCRNAPTPNCGPDHDFGSPPILRTLANGNTLLIAGQKSGNVWAHDPDRKGAVVWRSPLVSNTTEFGGKIVWGGAADEQNAYFGLGPGGIAAVQLRDGQRKWFTALQPAPGAAPRPGQEGALSGIPGAVISGAWDGVLRILSTDDGRVLWEYNTVRDFQTVNGVAAKGGSMGAAGPVVAGGLLFVPSGYVGVRNGAPGNVLLVFAPEN